MQCGDCGKTLRTSEDSPRGLFKSCPNCSGHTLDHHAYRRFPDEFGTTAARVGKDDPDGSQSWCEICRMKHLTNKNAVNPAPFTRCREVGEAELKFGKPTPPMKRRKA